MEEVWFLMFCIFGSKTQEKGLISQFHPPATEDKKNRPCSSFILTSHPIQFCGKGPCGNRAVIGELAFHKHCFNTKKKKSSKDVLFVALLINL